MATFHGNHSVSNVIVKYLKEIFLLGWSKNSMFGFAILRLSCSNPNFDNEVIAAWDLHLTLCVFGRLWQAKLALLKLSLRIPSIMSRRRSRMRGICSSVCVLIWAPNLSGANTLQSQTTNVRKPHLYPSTLSTIVSVFFIVIVLSLPEPV